ncbi:MAG: hypothetical protein HYV07_08010 [Deltaproteobacteria bacterium]|nr:hypothetical protein [Deltaproteobacteria bacterium]
MIGAACFLCLVAAPDAGALPVDGQAGSFRPPQPPPAVELTSDASVPPSDARSGLDANAPVPRPNESRFRVVYDVRLVPNERLAKVEIQLENRRRIAKVELTATPGQHLDFSGDGTVEARDSGQVIWTPPPDRGVLRFSARIEHTRGDQSYDARVATEWALFRGDDLIPRIKVRRKVGSKGRAELRFTLPKRWKVEAPYKRKKGMAHTFVLPGGARALTRPTGWIIAGLIQSSQERIGSTDVIVATPKTRGLHGREILTFLRWTLPKVSELVGALPPRLLIVGAGDPMWRGGLSAPASLFLHRDRPLVDDDGSSPLLHELVHVVTQAQSSDDGDWFVEGLAEMYSIELLHRAGGLSESARKEAYGAQERRATGASSLLVGHSTGATTARAVLVLAGLDKEIRRATNGARSLDDLVRELVAHPRPLSTEDFRRLAESIAGRSFESWFQEQLRHEGKK